MSSEERDYLGELNTLAEDIAKAKTEISKIIGQKELLGQTKAKILKEALELQVSPTLAEVKLAFEKTKAELDEALKEADKLLRMRTE